ncbi:antitoxin [Marispirochaeta aestuarii]|uniref:Antitoxin n=1 Tax=Marispirochaeta aestuarii TaxID=1963862 RepID=A0A1Y1RU09_9SPIO|nr:antitoxin [Marispirochaeta aestuarii]ORC28817.1 antitoxin [Marispirochaeta aestuarii]
MANLQVKDIDEKLYDTLRRLASNDRRSISQEVVYILQKYLSKPHSFERNPTDEFLKLSGSWEDDRSEDEIVSEIYSNRRNSTRFGSDDELFD